VQTEQFPSAQDLTNDLMDESQPLSVWARFAEPGNRVVESGWGDDSAYDGDQHASLRGLSLSHLCNLT
jgi:hypothetical protein